MAVEWIMIDIVSVLKYFYENDLLWCGIYNFLIFVDATRLQVKISVSIVTNVQCYKTPSNFASILSQQTFV